MASDHETLVIGNLLMTTHTDISSRCGQHPRISTVCYLHIKGLIKTAALEI